MEKDYVEELVMRSDGISYEIRESVYREMCHGITVSNYAREVAKEMGKEGDFLKDIEIAGLLHDIGKIRLNKYLEGTYVTKLIVERITYVRQHTLYSKEILEEKGYKKEICDAVFHHHENCDGSGYPYGIFAKDIPEMAKILRVCDVFTALSSDRPYRSAFDKQMALEMMIDEISSYDMESFLAFQRFYHSDRFKDFEPLNIKINDTQKEHLKRFMDEVESA